MAIRLYHFSDQPGIEVFTPRPSRTGEALVWAIEEKYAFKYLLPRDCPRVTFWPGANASEVDRQRLTGVSAYRGGGKGVDARDPCLQAVPVCI